MNREESSRRSFDAWYADYFVAHFRLPASVGRIAAALLLSRRPLSQADLREELGLSEGSVSEGIRILVDAGHVERVGGPRARPAYFQMRAASWSWPLASMLDQLQTASDNAERVARHAEEFGLSDASSELVERSRAMHAVLLAELPAVFDRARQAGERAKVARRPKAG